MSDNRRAFLDTIAYSEIGPKLLAASDNGYNVLVGGKLFHGYTDHPRKYVLLTRLGIVSSAAGRYQILARYYDAYKKLFGLPDFGHTSQDAIALQMIKEQHALEDIDNGNFDQAIEKCANIWASFPGAAYGQHENEMSGLQEVFTNAGGVLAS